MSTNSLAVTRHAGAYCHAVCIGVTSSVTMALAGTVSLFVRSNAIADETLSPRTAGVFIRLLYATAAHKRADRLSGRVNIRVDSRARGSMIVASTQKRLFQAQFAIHMRPLILYLVHGHQLSSLLVPAERSRSRI